MAIAAASGGVQPNLTKTFQRPRCRETGGDLEFVLVITKIKVPTYPSNYGLATQMWSGQDRRENTLRKGIRKRHEDQFLVFHATITKRKK
ncbi:MAG: hypothetical protein OXE94_14420 [Aestuariivita sp.]|nr:hypothetical protein [Aestuariivita sp.]MCY4202876.1 hypothetical protein [Aestuariivita sp.]